MQGQIVCFIPNRKFGFIHTTDGQEFFFHISNFRGTPVLGQVVEFEIAPSIRLNKLDQAVKVTPITTDADVAVLSGEDGAL